MTLHQSDSAAAVARAVGYPSSSPAIEPRHNREAIMDGTAMLKTGDREVAREVYKQTQAELIIPPPAQGIGRDYEDEARLALISNDDIAFKKTALALFLAAERESNSAVADERLNSNEAALEERMLHVRALTPGGIAWRLKELLRFQTEVEETSDYAINIVRAALADAIEQERARQAPSPRVTDSAARLGEAFSPAEEEYAAADRALDDRHYPKGAERQRLEQALQAAVDRRGAIIDDLIAAQAISPAGIRAKLRVLFSFAQDTLSIDEPENAYVAPRLFASVMHDLDRLAASSAPSCSDDVIRLHQMWVGAVRTTQAMAREGEKLPPGLSRASEEQEQRFEESTLTARRKGNDGSRRD
jgi:hypothetical protein